MSEKYDKEICMAGKKTYWQLDSAIGIISK